MSKPSNKFRNIQAIVYPEALEQKIYLIRGVKVMLDKDLAMLYGVETRVLNQSVRRNIERFPQDFIFALTRQEIRELSQNVISPGMKNSPNVFAFTEQGIAMLSSVLRSPRAIQVNITIMRVFVRLKQTISLHGELAKKLADIEKRVGKHDRSIQTLFEAMRSLLREAERPKRKIGFH